MRSVLFVCTANICRSPMAMALFLARVASSAGDWRIESAGTWTIEGEPAALRTRQVLEERGIDLGQHRSRAVTRQMLASFNLILTMERGHKEALRAEFPDLAGRIYMLSEMAGPAYDIRDPVAGSLADYQDAAKEIERLLEQGYEKICSLAEAG